MKSKLNYLYYLIPVFIFLAFLLAMQTIYKGNFFVKGSLVSFLPTIIFLGCYWKLKENQVGIDAKLVNICSFVMSILLILIIVYVGDDAETSLIAGCGIYISAALASAFNLVKAKSNTHELNQGISGRRDFGVDNKQQIHFLTGFNRANHIVSFDDNTASESQVPQPTATFDNSIHDISEQIVNPSSGLPMFGGISGLDSHGNSYGTNLNEPISNYDPNRGY